MTNKDIIKLYFNRDEKAIEQTSEKYGKYCHAIADNILGDSEDSKECVNDTLLKAWQSIPPLIPDNFKLYLAKITRNLAINRYKARNAAKRGAGNIEEILEELEACIPDNSNVEADYLEKELTGIINKFLKKQNAKRSNYFVRRYFYGETIEEIAKRYRVSAGSVMTTLSRTRNELKKYLESEGYV